MIGKQTQHDFTPPPTSSACTNLRHTPATIDPPKSTICTLNRVPFMPGILPEGTSLRFIDGRIAGWRSPQGALAQGSAPWGCMTEGRWPSMGLGGVFANQRKPHAIGETACCSPHQGRRSFLSACDATDPKSRTRSSGSLPSLFVRRRHAGLVGTRCARPWNPSSQRGLFCSSLSPFPKLPPSDLPSASFLQSAFFYLRRHRLVRRRVLLHAPR
jgi:hypothetical protein